MFPARLKLLMFGLLVQAVYFVVVSTLCAQVDSDSPDNESESQLQLDEQKPRKSVGIVRFQEPFQQFERSFLERSGSVFNRSRTLGKQTEDAPKKTSLFQLMNGEFPPKPAGSEIESSPGESNSQLMTSGDPPMQLEPIPDQLMQSQCETCDPVFGGIIKQDCCHEVENWSPLAQYFGIGNYRDPNISTDLGIGHERVMFAPFEIDPTQPTNFTMLRWDSGFGLQTPDRAEFFWSAPPKGPAVSPNSINYQEMRFVNEVASDSVSLQTDLPVRFIEPGAAGSALGLGDTSGMGDIRMATKARLINGNNWQITQIFRTYIPTGAATKGVGTGHVSLEPGVLTRYQISPATYVHGEVKYWIPIAGDPGSAGYVLTYGVGVSHVLYETNNFSIIPDLEMVNYDFLTGSKTVNGVSVSSSGETAVNLIPGARFVFGPKGDLGLFELGVSNMIGVGNDRYVNDLLRIDFKFVY